MTRAATRTLAVALVLAVLAAPASARKRRRGAVGDDGPVIVVENVVPEPPIAPPVEPSLDPADGPDPALPPPPTAALRASRRTGSITCDGRLDEASWTAAPGFDAFVQSAPRAGAAPSERTEVRVLYDDDRVFVGITAFDRRPAAINAHLGRRDQPPTSDLVSVAFDTRRDGRNAYSFAVNAGGVQRDGLWVDDGRWVGEWDAVWCGEATRTGAGWTAELEIPLHVLRFSGGDVQQWGIGVRRELPRTHEVIDSSLVPPRGTAMVSRFATLDGLVGLAPRRAIAVTPYVGFRLVRMAALPGAPLAPTFDVGADLDATLGSSLQLTATLNPDYGQVEADEAVLNLSTYETFLPEKRPFFLRGMELFEPIDADAPRLLYSRRIGAAAPIAAAAKVTGALGRLQVGALDAIVAGPHVLAVPDELVYGVHAERPLHFGPDAELPDTPTVTRNFLAVSARGAATDVTTIGAQAVASTPLSPPCTRADLPADAECRSPRAGAAAALHADARGEQWVVVAQAHGGAVSGGPADGTTLRDGTVVRSGDTGAGGMLRVAREGDEPWRVELAATAATPKLELNQTGFLRAQNELTARGKVGYVRTDLRRVSELSSELVVATKTTADGRAVPLGTSITWQTELVLPSAAAVGLQLKTSFARRDVREIQGAGVPFERPGYGQIFMFGNTDPGRALSLEAGVFLGQSARAVSGPAPMFGGAGGTIVWRPSSRTETRLNVDFTQESDGPRWVATDGTQAVFADLTGRSLSATLRQLVVLRKSLTLQAYAQVFTASGTYGRAYRAGLDDEVTLDDLMPSTGEDDPSFELASLDTSVVLRWEYRPGSTLFLVYARHQEAAAGPATDVALFKWSRLWDL